MLGKFAIAGLFGLIGATAASAAVVDPRVWSSDIVPDRYSGLLDGMPLFAANAEVKEAPLEEEFPTGQIDPLGAKRKYPRGYIVPLDNPIELVDHNPGSNVSGSSRTSGHSSLGQDIFATPIASAVSMTSSIAQADPALQQLNNLAPVIAVPNQVTAVANANVLGQVFVYESLSGSSNPVYVGSAYDPSLWQAQLVAATPPITVTPITTPPVTVPPVPVTTPPVTVPPVTVTPITTPPVTVPPVPLTTPPVTVPPVTVTSITTPTVTDLPVTILAVTTPAVTTPAVSALTETTIAAISTLPVTGQSVTTSPALTTLVLLDPAQEILVIAAPVSAAPAQEKLPGDLSLSNGIETTEGRSEASGSDFVTRRSFDAPVSVNAVPEPTTWAMMLIGFAGLSLYGWRRS